MNPLLSAPSRVTIPQPRQSPETLEAAATERHVLLVAEGTETAAELRQLYADLISQPDLDRYAIERSADTFGAIDIKVLVTMAAEARQAENPTPDVVDRSEQAKEILFRMHYGVIEKFIRQHNVEAQYGTTNADIVRSAGAASLTRAIDEFQDISGGGIGAYMWHKMRFQLYDVDKSADNRHLLRHASLDQVLTVYEPEATTETSPESDIVDRLARNELVADILASMRPADADYLRRQYGLDGAAATSLTDQAKMTGERVNTLNVRMKRARDKARGDFAERYAKLSELS